ncbi:MAG: lysophospholipid acyltransferase family protein [Betaproteobacteria bacterium]
MLEAVLRLLARLPLRWLHGVGAFAGWLTYRLAPRYAAQLTDNIAASGLANDPRVFERICRAAVRETGKGLMELPAIWFRSAQEASELVVEAHGWDSVEAARAVGRGILFLTPHLGCFEVSALYAATRLPITVLYRPPKLKWLEPLMRVGRTRGYGRLAPTTLGGVRKLLKALRNGEAVGLLPDHVPGFGEGVWAEFFGRPAYTMTLVGKLQKTTDCAVIIAFARRLPDGRGFSLELDVLHEDLSGSDGARRLNAAVEAVVRRCPEQYLWSYNRFKVPAGVAPPPAAAPR